MTTPEGYSADWIGIRRKAQEVGERGVFLREAYGTLREAFLREGRPLGDDQYGAELEKDFPRIRDGIFEAFTAHIEEVDGVQQQLNVTAVTYEEAEEANTLPSSPSPSSPLLPPRSPTPGV